VYRRRYTLEELDGMLEVAQRCVGGTKEAIAAAFHRRLQKVILPPASRSEGVWIQEKSNKFINNNNKI